MINDKYLLFIRYLFLYFETSSTNQYFDINFWIMKTLGRKSLASFIKFILNFAWYFQWVILVFVTMVLAIVFITKDKVDHDVPVIISTPIATPSVVSKHSDFVEPTLIVKTANLHFFNKVDFMLVFQSFLFLGLLFFITLSITNLLRKIFDTLTDNRPFIAANAGRLSKIGILMLLYVPVKIAEDLVRHSKATMHFLIDNTTLSTKFEIPFETIIAGLIVLVIAEIFRIGTRLKEEQELTV